MPGVDWGLLGRHQPGGVHPTAAPDAEINSSMSRLRTGLLVKVSPPKTQPAANIIAFPVGAPGWGMHSLDLSATAEAPQILTVRGDLTHTVIQDTNIRLLLLISRWWFLSIEQIETPEQLERGARQWKVRNESNVGKAHGHPWQCPHQNVGTRWPWAARAVFQATWHGQPCLSRDRQAGSKALCSQPATNQHPNKCFVRQ